MAAFACVTPASLLTLQPPDNFAIDAMDHAGEVCVGGLGVAVADDGVAIGEWVGIGIGHRGLNVSPPGSPGPMSALARIADSSRTSREVRKPAQ